MKRAALLTLALLLSLLAFTGLAAGFLLGTDPGAAWLWSQARTWVPGLQAGRITGSVAGGLHLTGLHYRHGDLDLQVGDFTFQWQPRALFRRELHVTRLALSEVALTLPEAAPAAEEAPSAGPPVLPELALPLSLNLEEARLDGLTVTRGESRYELATFELGAALRGQVLSLNRLHLAAPQGDATLTGHLTLAGEWPLLAKLNWSATLPDQPLMQGAATVEGQALKPTFALSVATPFKVAADGRADLTGDAPTAELKAGWNEARWPLSGVPVAASQAGTLQFSGGPSAYRLTLDSELHGGQLPAGQWQVQAHGDSAALTLDGLTAKTLDGQIDASGEVAWAPAVRWKVALSGSGLNPGAKWPEWPGQLALDARSEGALGEAGVTTAVRLENLKGRLRGYPVAGQAQVDLTGTRLKVEQLHLSSGRARVEASGGLDQQWDLTWKLDAPTLAHLLPQAKGSLAAEGHLGGPRDTPHLQATLGAKGIAYDTLRLRELSGDVDLDLTPGKASKVDLTAQGLRSGEQAIDRITLSGGGTPEAHQLNARLSMPDRELALALKGGWSAPHWRGTLEQLALTDKALGPWGLDQPVALDLAATEAKVAPFCWVSGAAQICASGQWQAAKWAGEARLADIPLTLARPWLPETVGIDGTLGGAFKADGGGTRYQGEGRLAVTGGALQVRQEDAAPVTLPIDLLTVESRFSEARAQVALGADLKEAGALEANADLTPPAGDWAKAALAGSAKLTVPSLTPFAPFLPGVDKPTGALAADLALAGSVAAPRVTGTAALTGLAGRVPAAGIELAEGTVKVVGDADGRLHLEGGIRSGTGTLQLGGEATLDPARGWPVDLTVKGSGFEAVNIPEARVLVSPDLTISLADQQLQVGGRVTVPEAKITVRELPESAVAVSPDVVVAEPGKVQTKPATLQVTADVELRLGEKVTLEGFGLNTGLGGALRVREAPDRLPRGEGELRLVNGTYKAYGQDLAIERGRLIFAGPVDNPAIDMRATRTVSEVVAGLQVTGTVRDSRVTLFSTPAMEQSEVLSYLLLGRPLSSASESDGKMMQKAVGALGVSGGNLLAKKIGSRLGLDEVKVESEGGLEEASLVLGRYLSPKLYVSYGVGLFQPGSSVRMRYDLSKRFKLQAESGTQSGMDVFYTIER